RADDLGDELVARLEVALEHLGRRAVGEAGLDQDHPGPAVDQLEHRLLVAEVAPRAAAARAGRRVHRRALAASARAFAGAPRARPRAALAAAPRARAARAVRAAAPAAHAAEL